MSAKVLLIIMDGWGLNKDYPGNAIALAQTPFFDELWNSRPTAVLEAAGESVGLPEGQMGTSEVNHFTIGAGRILFQDLVRINKAVADESFATNPAFTEAFAHVKQQDSVLHLIGLVSDGGVHSHQEHFYALVKAARQAGVQKLVIHAITDGRDTSPRGGAAHLSQLEAVLARQGLGRIGSLGGRYYAMDRDKNWSRTDAYFNLLTKGEGPSFTNAAAAIAASYQAEITDEFVKPCLIEAPAGEHNTLAANDAVIMVNFRNDRPRQITERLLEKGPALHLVTMTQYHPGYRVNSIAFAPQLIEMSLGSLIAAAQLHQLRITETEKFAHVTFFINCKHETALEGEDRYMFDSYSDIPTHDLRPEMRTPDIALKIIEDIESGKHEVIFTNLCNADMIGHTGNIPAAIQGCQAVDQALAKIVPVALEHGFDILITADHGNSDEMLNEQTGEIITSHSLNPVPLIVVSQRVKTLTRKSGLLIDIAPTILDLLGLETPTIMTGESLVSL